AARLPDYEREVLIQLTRNDSVTCMDDRIFFVIRKFSQSIVRYRCRFFQMRKSNNDFHGHLLFAYLKVLPAPLCLCSTVFFAGQLEFTDSIFFYSVFQLKNLLKN